MLARIEGPCHATALVAFATGDLFLGLAYLPAARVPRTFAYLRERLILRAQVAWAVIAETAQGFIPRRLSKQGRWVGCA